MERIRREGGSGHAALMDSVYRRQRHIYDLTRKYYLLGRDGMLDGLRPKANAAILEIGCGTARNLIYLAKRHHTVDLYGVDASREMLRTAAETVRLNGLGSRIRLFHGLAEDIRPETFGLDGKFDHAIFSYSLSMIPDWRGALAAAASSVREGGFVHVADFGDFAGLWKPASAALRRWLALFHVAPRAELLRDIESESGLKRGELHILPGRYAFVLKTPPSTFLPPVFGN